MTSADNELDWNDPYIQFLMRKAVVAPQRGYAGPLKLNAKNLKPHAVDIADWGIKGGARAIFTSFGMAKTSIQLQIVEALLNAFRGTDELPTSGLIVCPLGVRREFIKERKARKFKLEPLYIRDDAEHEAGLKAGYRVFLTNYDRIRNRNITPSRFLVATLDEAAVLRSYGSETFQTCLKTFNEVPYKFVATAMPSPNRYKELIHYAAFLGVMDSADALTRFFKRDSTSAGNLTLMESQQDEFYRWLSTWAVFAQRPSDLGHDDTGYDLPAIKLHRHRLAVDYSAAGFDSWGQGRLMQQVSASLADAAREKRNSLGARVQKCKELIEAGGPDKHWIVWHDLEAEREALLQAIPGIECISASSGQSEEECEDIVERFADGKLRLFGTKPILSGSGSNFQEHCHANIYLGISPKFHDFLQSLHRTQRYGQKHDVEAHIIHTETEDPIYDILMGKWENHLRLNERMSAMIREFGLSSIKAEQQMRRAIGVSRSEVKGEVFTCVNNDNVMETRRMADESVDLIVTSPAFSNQYEYVSSYNDFGNSINDDAFFEQMDFLTPQMLRILKPGRMACVHTKDRIVFGTVSGDGMYTVNPFSDKCVAHMIRHGFRFCGRITVVTDVVRENGQTYRLGWTENSKDGTKMGCGSSEYVLLFRKLPSSQEKSYADVPVEHPKPQVDADDHMIVGTGYSRARWQFDAHGLWRDNGNRFLAPGEVNSMPMDVMRRMWRKFAASNIYSFVEHVRVAEEMEARGTLPSSFMALDVVNPGAIDVWDDITRMQTLNTEQARKGAELHLCPLQISIVERLIERYSNAGEVVVDTFGGLGTVAKTAVEMGRIGYSMDLSKSYHGDAVSYCRTAETKALSPTLFDLLDAEAIPA